MTPQVPIVRERLLIPEEVAQWLQLSKKWVLAHSREHGQQPKLPCVRLAAGKYRYRQADIQAFLDRQFQAALETSAQGTPIKMRGPIGYAKRRTA